MNATIEQIAGYLRDAERVLLVAHVNPDADALGSTLATALALERLAIPSQVSFPDDPFEVPRTLDFLPRQDLLVDPAVADAADVVMTMDASSEDRVGRLLPAARAADTFIALDHHASFVEFAPIVHVDSARPATGLLVLDLIDALGVPLTPDIALNLYAAISSDTGSFRFASTTPEAMRAAARLMEVGIDFAAAARSLFDTKSLSYLGLEAEALAKIEVHEAAGVQVAVISVSAADRRRRGISFTQIESLIDTVRTVEGCEVAVVLKQDDSGVWRISSRSMGAVDVGRACTACGGGGHRMAAGFTGGTDPDTVLEQFLAAIGNG